jgi:glycosyltransferase involved in cell wall biosynthesis
MAYLTLRDREVDLVLIGTPVLEIPRHRNVRHLGFVSDADKFDVLCAADALVMPSLYESLSMVALEAWALGKPVIANGRCDVLKGQCIRSNAGLYYENAAEFEGAVNALLDSPELARRLGSRGRAFYEQHYGWPVVERKYLNLLEEVSSTPAAHAMEPLPGRLRRRRRDKQPAADVVAALPSGGVLPPRAERSTQ